MRERLVTRWLQCRKPYHFGPQNRPSFVNLYPSEASAAGIGTESKCPVWFRSQMLYPVELPVHSEEIVTMSLAINKLYAFEVRLPVWGIQGLFFNQLVEPADKITNVMAKDIPRFSQFNILFLDLIIFTTFKGL